MLTSSSESQLSRSYDSLAPGAISLCVASGFVDVRAIARPLFCEMIGFTLCRL
jgi:hypothetical protein